jgi:hypothetical protein|tara:strand:+ start:4406 stop:5260 length:855 start_codon:yes stop_codon:yes gene_type:complete
MATKGRIPIPKTQKEISNSTIIPYEKLERGNPNSTGGINRSEQISLKGDTPKPFGLGIKDIDEAISYYFNNVIKPSVIQNGQRIAVPIKYGSAERWKDAQRDGYYRDDKGKIMAPLIVFKRDNIQNNYLTNKLDANKPHNFEYLYKRYNNKNTYNKFNLLNNTNASQEAYAVVVPDFVTLTYSCIAYTYYVEQLNNIIESINYAANSYWGNPERFKFKALIDSFATITEMNTGESRNVKATFTLTLKGYLIPDIIQKSLVSPQKVLSPSKIQITSETSTTDLNT